MAHSEIVEEEQQQQQQRNELSAAAVSDNNRQIIEDIIHTEHTDHEHRHTNELRDAQKRIKELEQKLEMLERRIPKKHPLVTYLNYKNRRRILVISPYNYITILY